MSEDTQPERRRLELGRELVVQWVALFRAVHFYDRANDTIVSHGGRIREIAQALIDQDDDAEITVRHDSIFVNGLRIREAAVASTSYQRLMDLLRAAGVGALSVDGDAPVPELELFARLLQKTAEGDRDASKLAH